MYIVHTYVLYVGLINQRKSRKNGEVIELYFPLGYRSSPTNSTMCSINFMHGASLVAFSASGWMVYQQLENKNNLAEGASYESNGMELFEVFGITVDLNIWLPILIAIPLFLLGQVLASAKHAASAAVVEESSSEEEVQEEESEEEVQEEEEEEVVVAPKKKSTKKKKSRAKTPVKKASVKKAAKKSAKKSATKKKAAPKKKAAKKKAAPKAKKKAATKKKSVAKPVVKSRSSRARSRRSKRAPAAYDPSVDTSTTFF